MSDKFKNFNKLGSAHNGLHHWLLQRVTAIALIPLALWFTSKIICLAGCNMSYANIINSKLNIVLFGTLLSVMLLHSALGIRVIIEDYVSCKCGSKILILSVNLFAWFTAIFLFFAFVKNFVAII
jgi:succinate dehydrogenase / fumarate reductase membrane anchor subunit